MSRRVRKGPGSWRREWQSAGGRRPQMAQRPAAGAAVARSSTEAQSSLQQRRPMATTTTAGRQGEQAAPAKAAAAMHSESHAQKLVRLLVRPLVWAGLLSQQMPLHICLVQPCSRGQLQGGGAGAGSSDAAAHLEGSCLQGCRRGALGPAASDA